jgi:hypothetical protein
MNRYVAALLVVLLVGVVGILAIGAGYAKDENAAKAKCSEATLDGTYLFAEDGVILTDNEQTPCQCLESCGLGFSTASRASVVR